MSEKGLTSIGDFLTSPQSKQIRQQIAIPTPIQQRLIDGAQYDAENPDGPRSLLYQHTVLCQTCLPFRDPGDDTREWSRLNGGVHLKVLAGEAMHPEKEKLVRIGLPFGPKARMILMHINQQALQQKTPEIEVQDSLTKFVARALHLDPKGRNMRVVKDQLARLSTSSIRFGVVKDGKALTVNSQIVSAFDIWFPKDDRQRVLWPSTVRLSLDYWESLKAHAVPLDEEHIARLAHSSMALDIYTWLANRLHRITPNKPITISWEALHGQFGQGYTGPQAIKKFRQVFKVALAQVRSQYKDAKVDDNDGARRPPRLVSQGGKVMLREAPARGLTLYHSPPAVKKR